MYIVATDKSGEIWGGEPCHRCCVEILQTGISKIVTYERKNIPSKWTDSLNLSASLIKEAGIEYKEIKLEI